MEKDPKAEYSSIIPFFCYGETCQESDKFLCLPSAGATSPLRTEQTFHLHDGSTFSITVSTGDNLLPNGENLEGNSAPIDVIVYPTVENSGHYLQEIMSKI